MNIPIVYPQIRTSADMLKSTIRLETVIPFLKEQKAEACAIVNSKLYGLLPFLHEMKKAGIHPVIGLINSVRFEDTGLPFIVYAKNQEGYQNILKISSASAIRKEEDIPVNWLRAYKEGLYFIVPMNEGQAIWFEHEKYIRELKEIFGDSMYLGWNRQREVDLESKLESFAQATQLPIMALHESTFFKKEDHFAYEVARSIDTGIKLSESLPDNRSKSQFVPSALEWQELFADKAQWVTNTREVLLSCSVEVELSKKHMPKFPVQQGVTASEVLLEQAMRGLKHRLRVESLPTQYAQRLQYEWQIISQMGFADYFLIVADFMRFARENRILTGPGRGSSAGSLIAYSLYITDVEPLVYGLLFERFLNPERVTMPDIDIDFIDTRRNEVIQYVAEKYGKQHVAQIITFGTLSAKAVARDVARMFNFESATLEMISKLIPNRLGITLEEAYRDFEALRNWIGEEQIRKRWFEAAKQLEGLPRNASTHAAGVVLSPQPLVETVPIEEGHDNVYLTQWPMQEVEQSGLLKMDFLGLRNLTILEQIIKSIAYTDQIEIDLQSIPLDDPKTFELLRQGDTTGIFQLESDGMRSALKVIQPTQFLDIVAVNALFRPGPMDFIPIYAARKHGKEPVVYAHPVLEPILAETYGVIVYQEQIMRIANVFAGFSIGQADLLRRAVSKKKREVLEEQRSAFVSGALRQGYDERVANDIYELIVRFADYGFPKSHSVAYSLISYQLAYLKANFPINFYAALMTNAIGNQDKLLQLMIEAKSKGIEVLPPSISKSARHFKVEQGKIRFSLSSIKGVPGPFLKKLMQVRDEKGGAFEDIFDLAVSLSAQHFTRKAIEPLVKAGALDEFGKDRAVLFATIDAAVSHAQLVRPTEEDDLFSVHKITFGKPKYIGESQIPEKIKLQYEKEVLGFYISSHPITKLRERIHTSHTVQSLKGSKDQEFVSILGMVSNIRQIRTKKGERMAFVQVEDEFGVVSITLFPQEYNDVISFLKEESIVFVEGVYEHRFNKPQIKVKKIFVQK